MPGWAHDVSSIVQPLRQALSVRGPRRLAIFVLCTLCISLLWLTTLGTSTWPQATSLSLPSSVSSTLSRLGFHSLFDASLPGFSKGPYSRYRPSTYWHGWSSISHMIVFGDSWTMTDFHHQGERPSPENPFGNPGWPGITSTAGPNWVGYLTYKFNDSVVLTANFAVGGATVDSELIREGVPHFGPSDLNAQITEHFAQGWVNNVTYDWKQDSSLFVLWMGINDIHEQDEKTVQYFPRIFELFTERVDILYGLGARNFLFLNVPPLERAPLAQSVEGEYNRLFGLVTDWNKNLTTLVANFTAAYSDVSTFVFDTYTLYLDVLADPCMMPQTCGMQVLEGYCPKYAFAWYFEDPACPYHVDKYFWLNDFHPTSPVHNVTAAALSQALRAASP